MIRMFKLANAYVWLVGLGMMLLAFINHTHVHPLAIFFAVFVCMMAGLCWFTEDFKEVTAE